MQRYRHYQVDAIRRPVLQKTGKEKFPEGTRKLDPAPVFEAVDGLQKPLFIYAYSPGLSKPSW